MHYIIITRLLITPHSFFAKFLSFEMRADPELMFECLMHINAHYYPVIGITESMMTTAKFLSEKKDTPNIAQDAAICFTRLFVELLKLIIYYRFKEKRMKLVSAFVVFMTLATLATVYYTFSIQMPVLKLEYVLGVLTFLLSVNEVFFGLWFIMPCYTKVEYY